MAGRYSPPSSLSLTGGQTAVVDPPVGGVIAYTVLSPALTTVEFVALMMFVMFPQTIPALVPIII